MLKLLNSDNCTKIQLSAIISILAIFIKTYHELVREIFPDDYVLMWSIPRHLVHLVCMTTRYLMGFREMGVDMSFPHHSIMFWDCHIL